ncbi:branched-chain amino acid ABC transporter permease [Pseudorhodoferax sp.]|uniref:branched-chain amino acid ABC transporter permease n=1 Tax=Pseudorhodoferax sp. TaxID=1993553 RepID=UPI002DD684E5|nr:branched-chain amino acid ABC transporter permease [Pseudorhodoferax sp.]
MTGARSADAAHAAVVGTAQGGRRGGALPRATWAWGAAAVLFVLAPLVLGPYAQYVVTMWLIFAIAATGLNIPIGLGNIYSFGHGAFMLVGAYGTAVAMAQWGWAALPAAVLAVLLAGLCGAVIGLPSLRLTGFSLAIVTFAFGHMLFHLVKAFEYTGGPQGVFVPASAAADWLGGRFYYYAVGAVFALALWMANNLAQSRTGRALRVIGASEIVAQSLGVALLRHKIIAFTASALYGAVAGALLAVVTGYVAPETYAPDLSISIFAAVMIGGAGTLLGPVWGALFVVLVPELTQSITGLSLIVYGVLFTLVVTLYPGGLAAAIAALGQRLRRARAVPPPGEAQHGR